ncbi:hypothetical protein D9M71_683530 [compost metagenome]
MVARAIFLAGSFDSAAAIVTASVPTKLNMVVSSAPMIASQPLGMKPPNSVTRRLTPLTSRPGRTPAMAQAPKAMKETIATTLTMANQNSNSPYLATLNRLVRVSRAVTPTANIQVST